MVLILSLCAAVVNTHAAGHEHPWEWVGQFDLLPGEYVWTASKTEGQKYATSSMKLLILGSEVEPVLAWEQANWMRVNSEAAMANRFDGRSNLAVELHFDARSWISFFNLHVIEACRVIMLTEHSPDEYVGHLNRVYFRTANGIEVKPVANNYTEPSGVNIFACKILGMSLILFATLVGFTLRMKSLALNSPKLIGYVNVLTGSMFISMALFHILPECIHHAPISMQTLLTHDPSPTGVMLFAFLGFSLVLFFERVLFDAHGTHDHDLPDQLKHVFKPTGSFIGRLCADCVEKVSADDLHQLELQKAQGKPDQRTGDSPEVACGTARAHSEREHSDGCHSGFSTAGGGLTAVLLMIALSIHAVFEGILVGTASSVGTVSILVAIIVAHKSAEAFVVANALSPKQLQSRIAFLLLSLFALASPFGIVLGWTIGEMAEHGASPLAKLIESILNSLAVGTLFYIGMVEVVAEEFSGRDAKSKFIVFMTAATFIFALTLLHLNYSGCHSHAHAHGHAHTHAHSHAHHRVMV